jgi:hypothetical protein
VTEMDRGETTFFASAILSYMETEKIAEMLV